MIHGNWFVTMALIISLTILLSDKLIVLKPFYSIASRTYGALNIKDTGKYYKFRFKGFLLLAEMGLITELAIDR